MAEFGGGGLDPATNIRLMGYLLQQLAENDRLHLEGKAEAPPPAGEAPGSAGRALAAQTGSMAGSAIKAIAEEPESEQS
eukprot:6353160-Heterocapsa_arctica.AAC.1